MGIRAKNQRVADKKKNMVHRRSVRILQSDECKQHIEDLKTIVINDENTALVEDKLKATMKYRADLMKAMELDLLETFPYFFTHSKLVCHVAKLDMHIAYFF